MFAVQFLVRALIGGIERACIAPATIARVAVIALAAGELSRAT
jgi:hypothetical protein